MPTSPLARASCLALLSASLLASCASTDASTDDPLPGAGGKGDGASAAWTVLVYGAYDTHEGGIPSSLETMAQKVSVNNSRVNLLYLEDPPDGPNTKLWKVGARKTELVEDLGELHLGRPETLTQVLHDVYARYPASHVMVDLIGHTNSGVGAFLPDYFPVSPSWNDERMMYWQVRDAILASGVPVDVLSLSGCGTADLEVVARLADTAKYIVGLQEYNMGYTDVRWADSLARNPDISGAGLARRMAEGMFKLAYYDQDAGGATGAYDTSKLPAVQDALTALTATLTARAATNPAELVAARRAVLEMKSGGLEFLVDARDLADQLAATTTDPELGGRAAAFGAAIDDLVIGGGAPTYADEADHAAAHGINLVFMRPENTGRFVAPEDFDEASAWPVAETSFYEATGWRAFVTALYPSL